MNETDEYGYTGLHLAAEHGHMKVVEELMVFFYNSVHKNATIWTTILLYFFRQQELSSTHLFLIVTIFQFIWRSTRYVFIPEIKDDELVCKNPNTVKV